MKHQRIEELQRKLSALRAQDPHEPHHWIRLAEHFQYYATDLERALDAINKAIDKARQGNAFLRQAHGSRIRIALELRQFEYVEESLKALIAYRPPKDSPDVALEKDFIKKIPAGAVSDQLIASYKALLA